MAKEDKQSRKMTVFNRKDKDGKYDTVLPTANTAPGPVINQLDTDLLRQGQLYLIRVRLVKLALFEGWNDDSCLVFSILRDEHTPMRWSEGKYLAGDFDVFEAFDSDGNPPVWSWKDILGTEIPKNWFHMFEEARRRQADWNAVYGDDMKDNELSSRPQSVHGATAVAGSPREDGASSPVPPDRENLRAFIMGSATEPTNGSVNSKQFGTVNTAENKSESETDENGK